MQEHDILILGAGWTSTFLIPLLSAKRISFAATTRDGRKVAGAATIPWTFNPDEDSTQDTSKNQFSSLPLAKHILITFPLTGHGQSNTLVKGYSSAHGNKTGGNVKFIQLGSTGIWQIPQKTLWVSRKSPYDTENKRAIAEDELLGLDGCVLNLAGLWGGERDPKKWVDRVAKTKEDVKGKKSLHMIHGLDVARAIVAMMGRWELCKGERWMLTDGFVYDWWSLMAGWADSKTEDGGDDSGKADREPLDQARWVFEIMREEKVHALPRSMEELGRCYFGREFWDQFGLVPLKARI
ncbi:hypothetical protein LTR86_006071 [Recurvomyces mirabilis]|nr:hypothetical protein LTR86_006071 [Recurvomyces mirabilis]